MAYGQVVLDWLWCGQQCRTVWGVWHPGVVMPDNWEVVVQIGLAGAMELWEEALSNNCTLRGFWYREVTGSPPYPPQQYLAVNIPGANGSGTLPPSTAYTVSFITQGLTVRRGHANMPGAPKEFCHDVTAVVHPDALANLFNGWEAIRAVLAAENMKQFVLRLGQGVGSTIGSEVTQVLPRNVFGTQRTRKPGVGI